MIVVMPDGEHSFYTDSKVDSRLAFETYLTKDIIGFVDRTFPTIADRSGRALAGLSMGDTVQPNFPWGTPTCTAPL